jgi:hypothetical protein
MGHFWNPSKPDCLNVDESSLFKIGEDHRVFKLATQSLQEADYNYEILFRANSYKSDRSADLWLEKVPNFDGELDPPTKKLLTLKRCPMPDHIPPEGVRFNYDDPELQRAVETMQRSKAIEGSGSWPPSGCDPQNTGIHSIVVRIDPANMPSTIKAYSVQALAEVAKAYAEIGLSVRYALDSSTPCHIAKRFASLFGSTIGWNEFPSPNTCNQTIEGRLDTGYAPSNWLLWAGLECHETGHGVGLSHTRGSIMNPSILLINPLTWVGTPSFSSLERYFGGKPLTPVDPKPAWQLFLAI